MIKYISILSFLFLAITATAQPYTGGRLQDMRFNASIGIFSAGGVGDYQGAIGVVGSTGYDVDSIQVGDLLKTEQDPLLARTRKLLRHYYGFPANPKRRFGVPCVWSDEPQTRPPDACDAPEGSLNCAGFGACMPVTATFGLVAAGYVVGRLAD